MLYSKSPDLKYISRNHLCNLAPKLCGPIGFINGVFDLLHIGHMMMMYEGSKFCNVLIVAINSDKSTQYLKGPTRPIMPEDDRAMSIALLPFVSYVTIFDEYDPTTLLNIVKPNIFIKSDSYTYDTLLQSERDIIQKYNIETKFIPFYKNYSTTNIINKIKGI